MKKHQFNVDLMNLKLHKEQVRQDMITNSAIIADMHEELHEKDRLFGPPIFEADTDYPDDILTVCVVFPNSEKPQKFVAPIVPEPKGNTLQREAMYNPKIPDDIDMDVETEWESEMKQNRYKRNLTKQDDIINHMHASVKMFNKRVYDIRLAKAYLFMECIYLDLHILMLNQELMILKDCESHEDSLSEKVHARMVDLLDIQDVVTSLNNKMDAIKSDIDKLQMKEKELQVLFLNMAQDNKFFDFLRKIFKKKYKPPKIHTLDDSDSDSSSSSSDESEEDDGASVDSRDFGIIRLDESVCPKGCDQAIYDKTFQIRSERHQVELEIKELQRVMEVFRKEVETQLKKSRLIENNLKNCQEELETFQREKQQKLNQILCTALLRLDQIQNIDSAGNMKLIKDSLIFSKTTLSQLYKRVGQLKNQTIAQKSKHKVNVNHLARMNTDCKQMNKDISGLKIQLADKMKIKFGGNVNLDEVQESILKRLVMSLRMSMLDIRSIYEHELAQWGNKFLKKQKEYAAAIRDNTLKLELVILLNKEKSELKVLIDHQSISKDKMDSIYEKAMVFQNEIKTLAKIVTRQNEEIFELKKVIKQLKTRGYPIKPLQLTFKKQITQEEQIEEESVISEWEYIDDYMYTEEYKKEYWANKRAKEEEYAINLKEKKLSIEHMVMEVVLELLDTMEVNPHGSALNVVRTVMSDLKNKCEIPQIMADLLNFIPDAKEEHNAMLEMAAEKLRAIALQDELTDEELESYGKEMLNEILSQTWDNIPITNREMVSNLLSTLIQELPLNLLLTTNYMNCICNRLKGLNLEITGRELEELVMCQCSASMEDVRMVISQIIKRVYDTGMDMMFVIKDDEFE